MRSVICTCICSKLTFQVLHVFVQIQVLHVAHPEAAGVHAGQYLNSLDAFIWLKEYAFVLQVVGHSIVSDLVLFHHSCKRDRAVVNFNLLSVDFSDNASRE